MRPWTEKQRTALTQPQNGIWDLNAARLLTLGKHVPAHVPAPTKHKFKESYVILLRRYPALKQTFWIGRYFGRVVTALQKGMEAK